MDSLEAEAAQQPAAHQDARHFRLFAFIAALLAAPLAFGHMMFATVGIAGFASMVGDSGSSLPYTLQLLVGLSNHGILAALVLVVDLVVFALMFGLARRFGIGWLFAPSLLYAAMSVAAFFAVVNSTPMLRSFFFDW